MTTADVAAAISSHMRAFNDRDIDALMSGFTDDACWITGSGVARGRAELTELFTGAMTGLLPTLTIQNLLATSDRAACQLVETLTVRARSKSAPSPDSTSCAAAASPRRRSTARAAPRWHKRCPR
jgi:uncharacterized protein